MAHIAAESRSQTRRRGASFDRGWMDRALLFAKWGIVAGFLAYSAGAFAAGFSEVDVDTGNIFLDLVGRTLAGLFVMIL